MTDELGWHDLESVIEMAAVPPLGGSEAYWANIERVKALVAAYRRLNAAPSEPVAPVLYPAVSFPPSYAAYDDGFVQPMVAAQ